MIGEIDLMCITFTSQKINMKITAIILNSCFRKLKDPHKLHEKVKLKSFYRHTKYWFQKGPQRETLKSKLHTILTLSSSYILAQLHRNIKFYGISVILFDAKSINFNNKELCSCSH